MRINTIEKELSRDFLNFLLKLDHSSNFTSRHKRIMRFRNEALEKSRNGSKPVYRDNPLKEFTIELPHWVQDQRNQMTGPANDSKLCVRMINSCSPGVMLDLEDSLVNSPKALLEGHTNVKLALTRQLGWMGNLDDLSSVVMTDKESPSVVFTRVRGLHMGQYIPTKVRKNHYVSASLFDLAYHFYDMNLEALAHPPCIYIPKSENAWEAEWWRDAFIRIEKFKGWKKGTIKCMALIESYPMAYQIEDFISNLKDYIVGLNLGRWDYMASFIDYNYNDILFPDRNSIPTDIPFFQNLRLRMAEVCHKYGILAIGGMTALYPSRTDSELNERALQVLKRDKENEAMCFMDGAWTGHPDQNEIAVAAFPEPNQIDKSPGKYYLQPELSSFDELDTLPVTEDGTIEAVRTCIQYRQGVIEGRGASLINGYMEDLATDRIYRLIIAQRIDHGFHSEREVAQMFTDQVSLLGEEYTPGAVATWELIKNRQFNPR